LRRPPEKTVEWRKDKGVASLLRSRSAVLFLVLAALFLVFNFGTEALSIRQEQQRLTALQAEVAAWEQRRDQLRRWLDVVLSPKHMEGIARDQMMMGYPGDQVWVPSEPVVGETTKEKLGTPHGTPIERSGNRSYWPLWREFLLR